MFAVRHTTTALVWGAAGWQKPNFNTIDFDTTGSWDKIKYFYRPNVAGYYQFTGSYVIVVAGVLSATLLSTSIWKNGGNIGQHNQTHDNAGGNINAGQSCTTITTMNGTTDYVEAYVYSHKTYTDTGPYPAHDWFCGQFLGPYIPSIDNVS